MGNVGKLNTCLKELGGLQLDSFVERKRLQKTIYFLQEFGVDLGYSLGFYVYGPYSSELTDDTYSVRRQMEQARDTIGYFDLSGDEKKAIEQTKRLLSELGKNSAEIAYWLELLSSLHFLWKYAYIKDKNKEKVFEKLEKRKHIRSKNDLETAWNYLVKYDLVS